jgi:aryl-alcohol dehydrogenase-like predicted oxidoreductase
MEKRTLGRSGIQVAPFAFGGNVFGWTVDEHSSFRLLDAFVSAGFNLIDTADVYSRWKPGNQGGESETIIGNWLRQSGNRQKVVIATKVGADMGQGKKSLKKEYIRKAVEDSLKRLKTDVIDLYQSHWDDETLPVSEPLETYAQLIKEGKVKAIGASNFSAARLQEALAFSSQHGLPRYETFQPPYNLYERTPFETEYQQICLREQIGVVCYYSLASGFLSGKYRSEQDLGQSARGGGVKKYLNERGLRILDALDKVAGKHKATPATMALAWLMQRPAVAAPIASATSTTQLTELTAAVSVQLDAEDKSTLDDASRF